MTASLDRIFASFRPETVFHLAAVHFIPDCDADPLRCLQVNVEGTRAVLEATATLAHRVSLVLASSAAVYAPADGPYEEEDPWDRLMSMGTPSAGPRNWPAASESAPGRAWESPGSSMSSAREKPILISSLVSSASFRPGTVRPRKPLVQAGLCLRG